MSNVVDQIIDFENGELDAYDTVKFFSELIKSGLAWTLQGSYGRMAQHLIDNEIIDPDGSFDEDYVLSCIEHEC